jgi:hypothetical protein
MENSQFSAQQVSNEVWPQIRIVARRRALKGDNTGRLQALEW